MTERKSTSVDGLARCDAASLFQLAGKSEAQAPAQGVGSATIRKRLPWRRTVIKHLARGSPVFGLIVFTLSCSSDQMTAPAQQETSVDEPQPTMARVADEDALSIEDLLADELFQASVETVSEDSLREPLLAAVNALAQGQIGRAGPLIRQASDEADALLDEPSTDFDTLISWSVIERYFEEAELL